MASGNFTLKVHTAPGDDLEKSIRRIVREEIAQIALDADFWTGCDSSAGNAVYALQTAAERRSD